MFCCQAGEAPFQLNRHQRCEVVGVDPVPMGAPSVRHPAAGLELQPAQPNLGRAVAGAPSAPAPAPGHLRPRRPRRPGRECRSCPCLPHRRSRIAHRHGPCARAAPGGAPGRFRARPPLGSAARLGAPAAGRDPRTLQAFLQPGGASVFERAGVLRVNLDQRNTIVKHATDDHLLALSEAPRGSARAHVRPSPAVTSTAAPVTAEACD